MVRPLLVSGFQRGKKLMLLGVPSPFFPGILFLENPQAPRENGSGVEKNEGGTEWNRNQPLERQAHDRETAGVVSPPMAFTALGLTHRGRTEAERATARHEPPNRGF